MRRVCILCAYILKIDLLACGFKRVKESILFEYFLFFTYLSFHVIFRPSHLSVSYQLYEKNPEHFVKIFFVFSAFPEPVCCLSLFKKQCITHHVCLKTKANFLIKCWIPMININISEPRDAKKTFGMQEELLFTNNIIFSMFEICSKK